MEKPLVCVMLSNHKIRHSVYMNYLSSMWWFAFDQFPVEN